MGGGSREVMREKSLSGFRRNSYALNGSLATKGKNLPANARDADLGGEDPLDEDTATPSSVLAWRTPWTEEPGRLQSIGSH